MQYVKREYIDIDKWDACIDRSPNGLLYGYSFYLDNMAKRWDALVHGDYEAVMPLTLNRKFGINYLYQPPFTQQLGIFSGLPVTEQLIESFLNELHKRFRFAEIFLNYHNPHNRFEPRSNYILSLRDDYPSISANYRNVLEKNLRRALNANLQYREFENIDHAINLYKTAYGKRFPHVKKGDYDRFKNVCSQLRHKKSVILRGVFTNNDSLLASALLLKAKNRIHLIQSVTLNEGRSLQPNHFLLDNLIKEFAGSDLILDFEGSSIQGVADFYRSFGAVKEEYFFYRYNRLPWPLRLFK